MSSSSWTATKWWSWSKCLGCHQNKQATSVSSLVLMRTSLQTRWWHDIGQVHSVRCHSGWYFKKGGACEDLCYAADGRRSCAEGFLTKLKETSPLLTVIFCLQTLTELHHNAKLAHLNINCNNIMLCQPYEDVWDSLRLMDLGSAQKCSSGDS